MQDTQAANKQVLFHVSSANDGFVNAEAWQSYRRQSWGIFDQNKYLITYHSFSIGLFLFFYFKMHETILKKQGANLEKVKKGFWQPVCNWLKISSLEEFLKKYVFIIV